MREVEVAIGYTNGVWGPLWVEIPDNGYVLTNAELSEKAEEEALRLAEDLKRLDAKKRTVSFVKVLYIQPPEDDLSC